MKYYSNRAMGSYLKKRTDFMVITCRKSLEIVVRLNSGRILTLRIPYSSSILCQSSIHNIISNITTQQEPFMCNNRISSECRTLEQVQVSTSMERRLSIK